jgi:hypothetical protein
MAADAYGTWKVTFRDTKGRETVRQLVDTKADVKEQARFYEPSFGRIAKVEAAK